MIEFQNLVIVTDGKRYEIVKLDEPINISEHNNTDYPTEITHYIKGFDEDIYLVEETTSHNEIGFSFGYFLGDTGLFVSVEDEEVIDIANEIVFYALGGE